MKIIKASWHGRACVAERTKKCISAERVQLFSEALPCTMCYVRLVPIREGGKWKTIWEKGFEIGGLMEIRGEGFAESLGKVV